MKPDVYDVLRDMLTLTWRITDARLLDLCRLRLAQMAGARSETAGADPRLLDGLKGWRSSPVFSDRERAAMAFGEQYHLDHHLISDEQKDALKSHLSSREYANFVWALHMNDAFIRVLSLLDIEPDPPTDPIRPERVPPQRTQSLRTGAGDDPPPQKGAFAEVDPEFFEAYGVLGRTIVKQKLVDDVTSEAIRLHNASHQGCLY
jgi:hypothetical protein